MQVLILHLLLGEHADALRRFFEFQIELGSGGAAFDGVIVAALARGVAAAAHHHGGNFSFRLNGFGGGVLLGRLGLFGLRISGNPRRAGFSGTFFAPCLLM